MTRLLSITFAAFLASVQANTQSLRSPVIFENAARKLSYEFIVGYKPDSSVTDHNAIDLDQAAMETQLGKETESGFLLAKGIYEQGGNSKSYAVLTITSGNKPSNIQNGDLYSGTAVNGLEVTGKVYKDDSSNSAEIKLQYSVTDIQASYVGCQVGGLAAALASNTDGCFAVSGQITGPSGNVISYTYDVNNDNNNGRTLQGFSTSVQSKMIEGCPGCPYEDALMFRTYYGQPDYADHWVKAALAGTSTSFASGRGNADFSTYTTKGRGECVKKGTAYMNVFMYVIREFEDALDDCTIGCIGCNDDPVHAWDEGVAFYAGSLEGEMGDSSGKFLHQLADKRCGNFGTCIGDTGKSKVNEDLLDLFNVGQGQLQAGRCDEARVTTAKITEIMYVPLIQGTLRYAYKVDRLQGAEKEKAEGAVFAAAVIPRIYDIDNDAGNTIYENMRVGASSTDFLAVKSAFEGVYSDIGVACEDVGGLLDSTGAYYEDADPCTFTSTSSKSLSTGGTVGIVIGSIGGAIALVAVGYMMYMRSREKRGDPIFKASGKEQAV